MWECLIKKYHRQSTSIMQSFLNCLTIYSNLKWDVVSDSAIFFSFPIAVSKKLEIHTTFRWNTARNITFLFFTIWTTWKNLNRQYHRCVEAWNWQLCWYMSEWSFSVLFFFTTVNFLIVQWLPTMKSFQYSFRERKRKGKGKKKRKGLIYPCTKVIFLFMLSSWNYKNLSWLFSFRLNTNRNMWDSKMASYTVNLKYPS